MRGRVLSAVVGLGLLSCGPAAPTPKEKPTAPAWVRASAARPARPSGLLSGVMEIATEGWMTCALTDDAVILCWGSLVGVPQTYSRPFPVPGIDNPRSLVAGHAFYAVQADGDVVTWGHAHPRYRYEYHQGKGGPLLHHIDLTELLDPELSPEAARAAYPEQVGLELNVSSPKVPLDPASRPQYRATARAIPSRMHTDGRVLATGDITVCTYSKASMLSCAQPRFMGSLPSWNEGQEQFEPGLVSISSIGHAEQCLLRADGTISCLRFDIEQPRDYRRIQLELPGRAVVLAGGVRGTAALEDGRVVAWPQMGGERGRPVPPKVRILDGVDDAIDVANGGRPFSCALRRNGSVACWNTDGSDPQRMRTIKGVKGAKQLVAGRNHACVLLEDGYVQCWGSNAHWQRGNGTVGAEELTEASPGFDKPSFVLAPLAPRTTASD